MPSTDVQILTKLLPRDRKHGYATQMGQMGRAGLPTHHMPMPVPKITLSLVHKQPTKDDLHVYADRFFGDSQVHGFKEAYTAKSRSTRFFWVVVCLLCGGLALFEIVHIVRSYVEGSVATQISIARDHVLQYPTLMLCPTAWLSKPQMQNLGVDDHGLNFLGHYLSAEHVHHWETIENRTTRTASAARRWDRAIKLLSRRNRKGVGQQPDQEGKTQIEAALQRHSRMDSLLRNLTAHPRVNLACSCCDIDSLTYQMTASGSCFTVPFCRTTYTQQPDIHLHLDSPTTTTLPGMKRGVSVGLYNSVHDIIGYRSNPVLFAPTDTTSVIVLTMTKHVKISSRRSPCLDGRNLGSTSSQFEATFKAQSCMNNCIESIYDKQCQMCTMSHFLRANTTEDLCKVDAASIEDGEGPCSDPDVHEMVAEELRQCVNQCTQPCEERIRMKFHSFSYTLLMDVSTLELETFVSAIGGQLGLWCGASIISIFQLVSFVCCPCLYCREKAASIQRQLSKNLSTRKPRSWKGRRSKEDGGGRVDSV